MDLVFPLLSGMAFIFLVFLDLNFLTLILACLSISYFIEARIKGIGWKNSFFGSASVIIIMGIVPF